MGFAPVMAKYDALLDALPLPDLPPAAPPPAVAPSGAAPERATEPSVAVDPLASDDHEDEPGGSAPPPPPAPAPARPAANPGSAVYLTDKELLELQSASDDGEVSD